MEIPENRKAKPGFIWQCQACGKKSEDLYGSIGWHSYGWDESCCMNADQVPQTSEDQNHG